jgi:hypothetical protein
MFDNDDDGIDDVLGCMDEGDLADELVQQFEEQIEDSLDVGALPGPFAALQRAVLGSVATRATRPAGGTYTQGAGVRVTAPVTRTMTQGVGVRAPAVRIQQAAHEVASRSLAKRVGGAMVSPAALQAARRSVKVPGITTAVKLLRTAQTQRLATSEHRARVKAMAFERDVQARLARIEALMAQAGGERTLLRIVAGRKKS